MCMFGSSYSENLYQPDPGMRISQTPVTDAQIANDPDGGRRRILSGKQGLQQQAASARLQALPPPIASAPGAFALQIGSPSVGIPQLRMGSF